MEKTINNFFYPESICLAGASTKERSIGYELLNTIKSYGYTGKVFPVNPKADSVLGYNCYHSISEINEQIDLAIVAVPKRFAEDAIQELLDKGVRSIVLITAGFKEVGKKGAEAERRIVEMVKKNNARIVGPNCMGVINSLPGVKLNATFVAENPVPGKTAFLSQSGALGAAVLNSLRETDITFAHFISVGNKADINENDILHYWQNDKNINVITMYLESFENGWEFLNKFIKGEITKPTIVLKAGKTKSGMKAASSHTGALSSSDKVVNALLNQFGIVRAKTLNEMFNTAKGFENFPMPEGNRIAVVTNAGGPAILAIDAIEERGLSIAQLSEETIGKLREIVHPEGSVNNPVDLLPGGDAATYKAVNEILLSDKNVDAVISIFVEPVMVQPLEVIESVNAIKSNKPLFQVVMPLPEFWKEYKSKSQYRTPLFKNPEDPAEIISNMLKFGNTRTKLQNENNEYIKLLKIHQSENSEVEERFLSPDEIIEYCDKYNLPIPNDIYFSPGKIYEYAGDYPVVLKGVNRQYTHKSELNAIHLNIKNKEELINAANKISSEFTKREIELEEFLVQPYINAKHELLLGGYRDNSFGPVIMFGSGGKYVEVFEDTNIISAIASETDIKNLINSTKIGKVLKGVRGESPENIDALVQTIQNVCYMMLENPSIKEFDINPLILDKNGSYFAVDVRIKAGN